MSKFWDNFASLFSGQKSENSSFGLPTPAPPQVVLTKPVPKDGGGMTGLIKRLNAEEEANAIRLKRVAIIIGHDAMRQGVEFKFGPSRGLSEYKYNTNLATLIFDELAEMGIPRTSIELIFRDRIGVKGAYQAAYAFHADFVIELHFNASENPMASGCEVLIGDNSPSFIESVERQFVNVFCREMTANFKSKIRHGNGVLEVRLEDRGGGNVNALAKIPSVLIEPFFASNENESRAFSEPAKKQKLASAAASAIIAALVWR